MYSNEWEPVMTAETVEDKIKAFSQLAQDRADQRDQNIKNVVHQLTHNDYLMKHTSSDVLSELQDLEEEYPDAFYNGEANEHIMQYFENDQDFEFWYDHVYLALAAGLEWAILDQLQESQTA
jgi:gamma-glutamyltranspeptidase